MSPLLAVLLRILSILPSRTLELGAQVLNMSVGRGWGSTTVEQEVHLVLKSLKLPQSQHLIVFDIGANLGEYTKAWLTQHETAQVVGFEPSSQAFDHLQERFADAPRVRLINKACSEEVGEATLFSDRPASGLASLSRRKLDHFGISFNHQERVETVSLDEWCRQNQLYPNFVKLDVEGHELSVLRGARESLIHCQAIQFEFGGCNIDSRSFFQDFWYFLRGYGFDFFRMSPKGLLHIKDYSEQDEVFSTTNFLAVRPK